MKQVDPATQTQEEMIAGLVEHIFGPAEPAMKKMIQESQDLGTDIGSATLAMVKAAADQAEQAGREFDMEMLLNTAAEVIDALLELSAAMGKIEDPEDEDLRADALMTAVQGYLASAQFSPEEQEAAKQLLQQMTEGGEVDEAANTISAIGARRGIDPFADDEPAAPEGLDQTGQPPQPAPQPGGDRRLMMG